MPPLASQIALSPSVKGLQRVVSMPSLPKTSFPRPFAVNSVITGPVKLSFQSTDSLRHNPQHHLWLPAASECVGHCCLLKALWFSSALLQRSCPTPAAPRWGQPLDPALSPWHFPQPFSSSEKSSTHSVSDHVSEGESPHAGPALTSSSGSGPNSNLVSKTSVS